MLEIDKKIKEQNAKENDIRQIKWSKLDLNVYMKKCSIIKIQKEIKLKELVFILFRLTYTLRKKNKYWYIPSNYMLTWKNGYKYFSGRKLEKNKLAKILQLLEEYRFIKRKMKIKKRTGFRMGKNNPFYKQYFDKISTI